MLVWMQRVQQGVPCGARTPGAGVQQSVPRSSPAAVVLLFQQGFLQRCSRNQGGRPRVSGGPHVRGDMSAGARPRACTCAPAPRSLATKGPRHVPAGSSPQLQPTFSAKPVAGGGLICDAHASAHQRGSVQAYPPLRRACPSERGLGRRTFPPLRLQGRKRAARAPPVIRRGRLMPSLSAPGGCATMQLEIWVSGPSPADPLRGGTRAKAGIRTKDASPALRENHPISPA